MCIYQYTILKGEYPHQTDPPRHHFKLTNRLLSFLHVRLILGWSWAGFYLGKLNHLATSSKF